MTMTQKILAAHAGLDYVKPGQFIEANLDVVLANDITGPVAIGEFEKMGKKRVFDRTKVVLVPDHFTPNKDIKAAEQAKALRDFARAQKIIHYFEVGNMGIEHALLPEQGLVTAGDVVIGADSHTCTYGALGAFATGVGSTDMAAGMAAGNAWFKVPAAIRFELTGKPGKWVSGKDIILHIIGKIGVDGALYKSMEFAGEGLANLSMDDRFAMANMAIEAGAKNGIFPADEKTRAYMRSHRSKTMEKQPRIYTADADAVYDETIVVDLAKIKPTVAFPHLPDNTKPIGKAGSVKIDQAVIGSCTNGRLEDMAIAAKILKGRRIADGVRCIIIPGTQQIYLECVKLGYAETFVKSGAVFSTPTCGPCLGGHMGVLAAGEKAVSTTNRNFVGRMGHADSEVYLASPAVAAASAVTGKLTDPEKLFALKKGPIKTYLNRRGEQNGKSV
ncbi:MAG: 3-isopropylmalate dehydratase large subunit [Clostridiales Family XIII bacterium]|nr:3-isopropylmalate dehydratase large subunit [Clostridiales Family XIII bacterium]